MKKLVFFVVSSLLVFAGTIYYRLGAYKDVEISVYISPEIHLLYKEHFGAYHKINDVITEVEQWALVNNVSCSTTFGEYLDDPRTVDERRLRSLGGCVLKEPLTRPTPYLLKTIGKSRFVKAKFEGAPSLGPLKVYPKVEEYLLQNKISRPASVLEIYDVSNKTQPITEYLFQWPEH